MRLQQSLILLMTAACAARAQTPAPSPQSSQPPSLVVFITIDQMRPDYFDRWGKQLTGGLARLRDGSAFFANGYHDHAITETAPGHASTLSGRFPRSTGVVANVDGAYDPAAPLIGTRGDPASPYRFRGSTLADWLKLKNPRTRALSVSRKDRGAIFPLGRAKGEAYWFAPTGLFTTSTWYADTLPTWVQRFNARKLPQKYAGKNWDLLLKPSEYSEPDTVFEESGGQDFIFPHPFPRDEAVLGAVFANYPMMDEVTLQFALEGLKVRELGSSPGRTDLLAVSLSTTDAIGHKYGPDSREIHDHILRLDRALGSFLDELYQLRDSSRVVIALTADHAVAPYWQAEVASRYRKEPGGIADIRPVVARIRDEVIAAGVDSLAFRYDGDVLYLEPGPFARARVSRDSVARVYAAAVAQVDGVLRADVWEDLRKKDPGGDVITRRWQHMFPPDLPVAVTVTLKPFWYWAGIVMATHGSPHDYDAQVPILFAGAGVRPGRHADVVRVVDIAPTLAALLDVRPTEPLDGVILRAVLR